MKLVGSLTEYDKSHYEQGVIVEGFCEGDQSRPGIKNPPPSGEKRKYHAYEEYDWKDMNRGKL